MSWSQCNVGPSRLETAHMDLAGAGDVSGIREKGLAVPSSGDLLRRAAHILRQCDDEVLADGESVQTVVTLLVGQYMKQRRDEGERTIAGGGRSKCCQEHAGDRLT